MHRLIASAPAPAWVGRAARGRTSRSRPRRAVAAVREHAPDVVFLCSPNNPTGTALDPAVLDAVLDGGAGHGRRRRGVRRVLRTRPSLLPLLAGQPRLVVTRTMSKAFGFAGARVGYLAADPAVVEALRLVRLPYHLSALTQAAALARAAARRGDARRRSRSCGRTATRWCVSLRARGLRVVDSDANFVLFGGFAGRAGGLAGAARPRGADPRRRAAGLAAGQRSGRARSARRSSTLSTRASQPRDR